MRRDQSYDSIHATDLEAQVASLHAGNRTRADYVHGDFVRTVHLVASARKLTVALVNSRVERLPVAERDALFTRIAKLGLDWLSTRSLLVPGTLLSVSLHREVDLELVSWSWGVGGAVFWVDELGGLTREAPRVDD